MPETWPCVPRDHRIRSGTCPQGGPRAAGLAELGLRGGGERDTGSGTRQGVREEVRYRTIGSVSDGREEEMKEVIQWNTSNTDSKRTEYIQVSILVRCSGVQLETVSLLERCPHFRLKIAVKKEEGGELEEE